MASFAVFDESFYLANNPDVAAAVVAGTFSSGLDHYIQFGARDRLNASIPTITIHLFSSIPKIGQSLA